jgi:hypothetical protein
MNSRFRVFALAMVLGFGSAHASDDIPDRAAYAWQFPITIEQSAEFVATDIPLEVYRSASDSFLRDVGVYNAAGQAVPRIIRQHEEKPEDVEHRLALGIVPLYGELEQSQERLRLLMESNQSGTRLHFDSGALASEQPAESLQAYIVDLRDLEDETFTYLEFEWADSEAGFIGNIFVQQSDDLSRWRSLAHGTLADLEFEGTRIERNRVETHRETGDFLRITWSDMPEGWKLDSLTGIRRERGPDDEREWLVLTPVERSEDGREFIFDIRGFPPVDRANLVLAGNNVVVRASLDFRSGPESNWRRAHQGLFYNISRAGNEITSDPARLAIYRNSQWKVRIHSGRVDGNVKLRLGWRPEQLMFLHQGEPPFTLSSGRAQDSVENYPQHRLLGDNSLFTMLLDAGEPGRATVGTRSEAAGAVVMEGARTWTWRTVVVWIGLIGAVLFVGWMVWSLMRENNNKPTQE